MASNVRICSLLPPATEIMGRLGMSDNIVCVTHKCDAAPDEATLARILKQGTCRRVTTSAINPDTSTQAEIDAIVQDSVDTGFALYRIDKRAVTEARPNVIVTQDLCSVCAPTSSDVAAALSTTCNVPSHHPVAAAVAEVHSMENKPPADNCATGSCDKPHSTANTASIADSGAPVVVSLEPQALADVAESCVTIARACGVEKRGEELRDWFLGGLHAISDAVGPTAGLPEKKVFILEWTDPPFDAGNWVPEVIQVAQGRYEDTSCSAAARSGTLPGPRAPWGQIKSKRVTWEEVAAADPDVIIVSCCGFDYARNATDGCDAVRQNPVLQGVRAIREGHFFAADGNRYLAKSGPSLVQAAAMVAAILWYGDAARSKAIAATGFLPEEGVEWGKIAL
eukprot:jgi/Ulvmu1/927/UM102_0010.1